MKASELMIGDWVLSKSNDKNYKIDSIIKQSDGSYLLATKDGLSFDYMFEPIPLTPEILEKNGFIKTEEERGFSEPYCVYVCDDFQYVIKIYPKGLMDRYSRLYIGECDDYENMSLLINYVHELQHELKRCGKEIEL